MTMTTAEKTRETRLRRMADRQGLELRKSRRRDPRALDYGRYVLVDSTTSAAVGSIGRPIFTLDDVEAYLTGEAR